MSDKVKGWKCFDSQLKCKNFQFEIGKTYVHDGPVVMCESGFHFHEQGEHLFNYYPHDSRVCEVEAVGVETGDDKSVAKQLTVGRELRSLEAQLLCRGYGNGDGYGYGYGDGYGNGNGDGYGNGYGDGDGYGNGNGDGYGNGYGDGYGNGNGYGDGYGNGNGYGDGYGNGNGYGNNVYLFSYIKEAI